MTDAPNAEPSPRALGESLAALAVQVAALRDQVHMINARLDSAGLRDDLDLGARFEELAQTVAGTLEAAAPRGPAAPYWIGLDRDTLVVPGLLQTEPYARAILSTRMGATREELDEAVAGRMERQRILHREHPPELWVILDEAVLRRPVGGPDVLRDQLARLAEAGQRPNIAIQVVPFGAGAHEGLRGGAFIVADFDGAAAIAYQDAASSGQILEDAADVEALALTWDTLRLDALPRTASTSLITSVAETV